MCRMMGRMQSEANETSTGEVGVRVQAGKVVQGHMPESFAQCQPSWAGPPPYRRSNRTR